MQFNKTPLVGAYTIDLDKLGDDRGFFARLYCSDEFSNAGLINSFVQINNSLTKEKGTLRGMHYQLPPVAEVKVVRCVRGSLFDMILDIRPDSPTFGKYYGETLSAENRRMMYVPQGFAHGFLTLEDDTEAFYLVSSPYGPEQERGIRFNDPEFKMDWPLEPEEISEKDRSWPDFDSEWHGIEQLKGLL